MADSQLFDLLLKCNAANLDAVTVKLGLDPAFLPGRNEPTATRASAIFQSVNQPGGPGFSALKAVLEELYGKGHEPEPHCILVLAANPVETEPLRLDEEVRVIQERLNEPEARRHYKLESKWAVHVTDLSRYLLQYKPQIVHFSGHGSPTGEIVLEDDIGRAQIVPSRALTELFNILRGNTECVVLNACYSLEQATMLAGYVDCVIGMAREIGDRSALRFAAGFYRGLAFGTDYPAAFRLGCNEIDLASLPDAVVPHFTTQAEDKIGERRFAVGTPTSTVEFSSPKRTWALLHKQSLAQDNEDAPRLYPLWYGTNRRPVDRKDPSKGYTPERDDHYVYYGTCKVAVPKSHKIGSVGSSWLKRILTWSDDRLKLIEVSSITESGYWPAVRNTVAEWDLGERMAVVFIHGFNVSFEGAALRAAQIGVDLKFPGVMAFYSWPSKGTLPGYPADEATIEASERQIADFLIHFAMDTEAERVHLIAHSMGNRALLRSLERIVHEAARLARVPFGQVFLAAPDVDAAVFRERAKAYTQVAQRATLYVSSRDRALASSGLLHDYPRAGYTPPVTVVDGIDTVEVSDVDLTFLGHGYYAAARNLLHDMHELLLYNSPPATRLGLNPARTFEGHAYWQIGA